MNAWIPANRATQWTYGPGLVIAAFCAALAGCATTQVPAGAAEVSAAGTQETAGFQEALQISHQRYPDAPGLGIEFTEEDGRQLIETSLWVASDVRKVYVDPRTRTIVKEEIDSPSADEATTILKIVQQEQTSLEQAIQLALNKHSAQAVRDIELQMRDSQLVTVVETRSEGDTADWVYDAGTGQLLKREQGFMQRIF